VLFSPIFPNFLGLGYPLNDRRSEKRSVPPCRTDTTSQRRRLLSRCLKHGRSHLPNLFLPRPVIPRSYKLADALTPLTKPSESELGRLRTRTHFQGTTASPPAAESPDQSHTTRIREGGPTLSTLNFDDPQPFSRGRKIRGGRTKIPIQRRHSPTVQHRVFLLRHIDHLPRETHVSDWLRRVR
jgi:hypothetical protein